MIRGYGVEQEKKDIEKLRLGYFAKPGIKTAHLNESDEVIDNPDKGWVIHYYDNTLSKYGARLAGDDLADFPGFAVVYLRLAWSYVEPEEGRYNWDILDEQINRWTAMGKKIAFRISCCESSPEQPYATPGWVEEAGARGVYFGKEGKNWEPDYGDPVFLDKLEKFLQAFAERYDNNQDVAFMDMGSYGVWGEWHTSSSSKKIWPVEVLKKHIDLHAKYFKKTRLIILYGAGREVCSYARERANAGLRTDSVGVNAYYVDHGGYWTEKLCPPLDAGHFEEFWRSRPVVVEPDHYRHSVRHNTWQRGSTLARAVEDLHPTWVTVHHWPREWLEENRELAGQLANRMGYWFMLKTVVYPGVVKRGSQFIIQMNWENRGVAPIYKNYPVAISLKNRDGAEVFRAVHPTIDIRSWMPTRVSVNNLRWIIPGDVPAGKYLLRVGLVDAIESLAGSIKLGSEGEEEDMFYRVGEIEIV